MEKRLRATYIKLLDLHQQTRSHEHHFQLYTDMLRNAAFLLVPTIKWDPHRAELTRALPSVIKEKSVIFLPF